MAKTEPFALSLLTACFALGLSYPALAEVKCHSTNTSSAYCQHVAEPTTLAPTPGESQGIRLNSGIADVFFNNYPSDKYPDVGPRFVSNHSGNDLFVPQAEKQHFSAFLNAAPKGVEVHDAVVPGIFSVSPYCDPTSAWSPPSYTKVAVPGKTIHTHVDTGNAAVVNDYTFLADSNSPRSTTVTIGTTAAGGDFEFTHKSCVTDAENNEVCLYAREDDALSFSATQKGTHAFSWSEEPSRSFLIYTSTDAINWSAGSSVCPASLLPKINGSCGSANGNPTPESWPTGTALCASGNLDAASKTYSEGIYSWKCKGLNEGLDSSMCKTTVTATCGTSFSYSDVTDGTAALCSIGSVGKPLPTTSGLTTTWNWTCKSGSVTKSCDYSCTRTSCLYDQVNYPYGLGCESESPCDTYATGKFYDLFAKAKVFLAADKTDSDSAAAVNITDIEGGLRVGTFTLNVAQLNMPVTQAYQYVPFTQYAIDNPSAMGYHQFMFSDGSAGAGKKVSWHGVCYDGSFSVPSDGWYTFVAYVDDALAIYVDGTSHRGRTSGTYWQTQNDRANYDASPTTSFTGLVGENSYGFIPGSGSNISSPYFAGLYADIGGRNYPSLYVNKNMYGNAVGTYAMFSCVAGMCPPNDTVTPMTEFKRGGTTLAYESIWLTGGKHNIMLKYINGPSSALSLGLGLVSGTQAAGAVAVLTPPGWSMVPLQLDASTDPRCP